MAATGQVTYEKIPFADPSAPVTADDLDRVQQAIQKMAAKIPVPAAPNVVTVTKDYQVTGTEDVLHVNAQTGPVKITLLNPSSANRPLTIKQVNLQGAKTKVNQVTVVSRDGSATIAGQTSLTLDDSGTGSVSLTSDNQQHWPATSPGGNPPTPTPGAITYVGVPPIYVSANVISFKAQPTPPVPPPTTPWFSPIVVPGPLGDKSGSEVYLAEWQVDFTAAPGAVTLYLALQSLSALTGGVFNVRLGGSAFQALDGAIIETWTETSPTFAQHQFAIPVTPPVGAQPTRVTLSVKSAAAGQLAQVQGINGTFR